MTILDGQDLPPAKILIVDDEPLNIEVLSEVLEDEGETMFATNGPNALDIALEERPDIILLDIMMPDMDGYEVCERLKADPRTAPIPVVFITALNQETDEARGISLGAVDYLTKPISEPITRARVRNHVELKRVRDYLSRLAFIDGLTGVPNRRAFDDHIERELARARRRGAGLSVMLMDIDHFKKYNDALGHQQGDDCLRRVATALAAELHRPGDMLARYGGEEFVCVLPETEDVGGMEVAERLRAAVEGLGLEHPNSGVGSVVTISVGHASAMVNQDTTADDLLKAADAHLYKAKDQGRNRVVGTDTE